MNNSLLAYAFNAENKLVHIDDVKNGLECQCICPGCREPLIAKNDGKIREHHFAHVGGNDCGTGYQTIRHIWGKEILCERKCIPIVLDGKKQLVPVEAVGMEIVLRDLNIIPDVFSKVNLNIGYMGIQCQVTVPVIVEILVTHKVDEEKTAIIQKEGIPAVEIDLSKSIATTKEELEKDLYCKDNWNIVNDKLGAKFTRCVQDFANNLLNSYRCACGYPFIPNLKPTKTRYNKNYRRHR